MEYQMCDDRSTMGSIGSMMRSGNFSRSRTQSFGSGRVRHTHGKSEESWRQKKPEGK